MERGSSENQPEHRCAETRFDKPPCARGQVVAFGQFDHGFKGAVIDFHDKKFALAADGNRQGRCPLMRRRRPSMVNSKFSRCMPASSTLMMMAPSVTYTSVFGTQWVSCSLDHGQLGFGKCMAELIFAW